MVLSFTIKETLPAIRGIDNQFLNHHLIAEDNKSPAHELQLGSETGWHQSPTVILCGSPEKKKWGSSNPIYSLEEVGEAVKSTRLA